MTMHFKSAPHAYVAHENQNGRRYAVNLEVTPGFLPFNRGGVVMHLKVQSRRNTGSGGDNWLVQEVSVHVPAETVAGLIDSLQRQVAT